MMSRECYNENGRVEFKLNEAVMCVDLVEVGEVVDDGVGWWSDGDVDRA